MMSNQLRVFNKVLAATAILLAVAAIYFVLKMDRLERELQHTRAQLDSLYTNYQILHTSASQSAGLLRAMSNDSIIHVRMSGMPIAPNAEAYIYWNPSNGQVYINPAGLPAPGQNEYYQVWAFKGDSAISLGVIYMQKSPYRIQRMRDVMGADEFAVIKVEDGEKSRPMLENMMVATQ